MLTSSFPSGEYGIHYSSLLLLVVMKKSFSARLTQLIEVGVTPHYSYEIIFFS